MEEIKIQTPYGVKNWAFVKRCFDSHEELVSFIEMLIDGVENDQPVPDETELMRAAKELVKKARGEN